MATLENLTIMFTDIVGFSDLVAKLPRSESEKLLEIHDRVLAKVVRRFGGKTIKSIGDSLLVTFRSPTDAVLCGMAMHDALWEANRNIESQNPIIIRVALNAGEVRLTNNDVFGDAVNIAARLESITPSDAVYLTEAVYLSMSKSEANLEMVDAFKFKGVADKIRVYQATHKPIENKTEKHLITDELAYPYGGTHIHHKASHSPLVRFGKLGAMITAFCLVIISTWWATRTYTPAMTPERIDFEYSQNAKIVDGYSEPEVTDILSAEFVVSSQLKAKAAPFMDAADYDGLQNLVAEHQELYSKNAYLRLLAAHTDLHFNRYKSALSNYGAAFEADASLANDPITAENLMLLLRVERSAASQLIAENLSDLLILKLGERTGQEGLRGRYDAFYLLKDTGHSDAVDLVGLNIWDLRELDKCDMKKTAVVELKRLKDERALEALKEVINVGLIGRFKYSCLRKEAKEAIAVIEQS